jgi:hypothetical protein
VTRAGLQLVRALHGPALLGAAAIGCAAQEPRPVAPSDPAPVITFADGRLATGEASVEFPADAAGLARLFGPCSREIQDPEHVWLWDELGIVAQQDAGSGRITELQLHAGGAGPGASATSGALPTASFRGWVQLPGGRIGVSSTTEQLEAAGLAAPGIAGFDLLGGRLGACTVVVARKGPETTISLRHDGFVLHRRSADGSPPSPLFSVRARDVGCDFDENLTEVSRDGNISVVRLDMYGNPSQGSVGKSMFDCGAIGALAIERGFENVFRLVGDAATH